MLKVLFWSNKKSTIYRRYLDGFLDCLSPYYVLICNIYRGEVEMSSMDKQNLIFQLSYDPDLKEKEEQSSAFL